MRMLALIMGMAACVPPQRQANLPELVPEPREASWLDHAVALRTALGRAGIRLEMAGSQSALASKACLEGSERKCVRCELLGEQDQVSASALEELVAAFARYPVALLDAARIDRVALCRRLDTYDDQPAGLADVDSRILFVNVQSLLAAARAGSGYSVDYVAETAHHEVYHLFDIPSGTRTSDLEWDELNAHGFAYSNHGKLSDPRPFGFVNAYATTNGDEDRASTFQFLMARGDELCTLAKDDPTLLAKARVVWKRVSAVSDAGFLRAAAPCADQLERR